MVKLSDLMTVSCEHQGDIAVLAVSGEVDLLTAPALQDAVDDLLKDGSTRLIVDLSAVTFLGSIGLKILASTQHRLGRGFVVVANGPATSRAIQLIHLDRAFPLCLTLDEALTCVRNS